MGLDHLYGHPVRLRVAIIFYFVNGCILVNIWEPIRIGIITLTKICDYLFGFAYVQLVLDLRGAAQLLFI